MTALQSFKNHINSRTGKKITSFLYDINKVAYIVNHVYFSLFCLPIIFRVSVDKNCLDPLT